MRFRREALAATVLRHPNIVACLETGTDDGQPFLVMELIEGEDLAARLRRGRPPRAGRGGPDRARRRPRARRRAHPRDRPSRREARQHPARARRTGDGHRLRDRPAGGRRRGGRPGHDARLGPLLQPGAGQGRDDDRRLGRLQPRPRPVRVADRPAGVERRDDGRAGGGPDRRRRRRIRATSGPRSRPRSTRSSSARSTRTRARYPNGQAMAAALEPLVARPDPASPTVGDRLPRCSPLRRSRLDGAPAPPGRTADPGWSPRSVRPPVAPGRRRSDAVRRAPPAIAAPLVVLLLVVGGRRRRPAARGAARSRRPGGVAFASPTPRPTRRHADTDRPPDADPDATPAPTTGAANRHRSPRHRPEAARAPASLDLCDPFFGVACGLDAGTYEPTRFEPPIRFKLGGGWSVADSQPDLIALARDEGPLTFASAITRSIRTAIRPTRRRRPACWSRPSSRPTASPPASRARRRSTSTGRRSSTLRRPGTTGSPCSGRLADLLPRAERDDPGHRHRRRRRAAGRSPSNRRPTARSTRSCRIAMPIVTSAPVPLTRRSGDSPGRRRVPLSRA